MFTFDVSSDGAVPRIAVGGEIDASCAEQFRADIRSAVAGADASAVVLDLARLTFIDSSGLGALVGATRVDDQVDVELVNARPHIARLLVIAGLDQVFTIRA